MYPEEDGVEVVTISPHVIERVQRFALLLQHHEQIAAGLRAELRTTLLLAHNIDLQAGDLDRIHPAPPAGARSDI
jgi:hypothetical protein